tara:strand:+ start:332 stop:529 length:198 start_codon:yes stop_codon:yes gene_type:complete
MTELDRLTTEIRQERRSAQAVQLRMLDRLTSVDREIATLKVRCGIWGVMGGLIPAVAAAMIAAVR